MNTQEVADDDALLDRIGAGAEVSAPDELAKVLIGWRAEGMEGLCLSHDAVMFTLQRHSSLPTSPPVSSRSTMQTHCGCFRESWRDWIKRITLRIQRNSSRD